MHDRHKTIVADVGQYLEIEIRDRLEILEPSIHLLGRPRPPKLRTAAEIRDRFEQAWRGRLGNERFDRLMEEINAMAREDLDRANHHAAQALWELARKRRAAKP